MLDSYTHENMRDFGPRYADTYGFLVKPDQTKQLVYISENDRNAVYFRCQDDGLQFHANIDSGVQFEFIQVDRGFFTGSDGNIYFMCRVPARQWKRGIGRNNTSLKLLTENGLTNQKLSLHLLSLIFNRKQSYLYDDLLPTQNFIALSKHFAMTTKKVYFFETEIGTVDHQSQVISVDSEYKVTQELNDVIRRNGYSYTVKETDNG